MTRWITVMCVLTLCANATGCKREPAGPTHDDVAATCRDGEPRQGLVQAGLVEGDAPQDVLVACMQAAAQRALEHDEWDTLDDWLGAAPAGDPRDFEPELYLAAYAARCAMAYAGVTGKYCCEGDGASAFAELSTQVEGDPVLRGVFDEWYTKTRTHKLAAGELFVEADGMVVFVGELHDLTSADRGRSFQDVPLVLHNVLLMSEDRSEPRRHSGDPLVAGARLGDERDASAHRLLLARRPGAMEPSAAAIAWTAENRATVESIHPGVLHTCEGQVTTRTEGKILTHVLALDTCRAENDRTDALFNKRWCEVCGERDEIQFCAIGKGRSDNQAVEAVKDEICSQLMREGEDPAECARLVRWSRKCDDNTQDRSGDLE
jgi:hypothetical protein